MKKMYLLLLMGSMLCMNLHGLNAQGRQQNETFEFITSFKNSDTKNVQNYLDKHLGTGGVFANTEMDATITLKNGMKFYIQLKAGILKILFDKNQNTTANYSRMKETCQAIQKKFG